MTIRPENLARRKILRGGSALAVAAMLPLARVRGANAAIVHGGIVHLSTTPSTVALLGPGHPDTAVWTYDGRIPGPELRFRQGSRLQVVVQNGLTQSTTVHWHGLRVPNEMDGVPGLTQPPIVPGGDFSYAFDLKDAGTYWYHSHDHSAEQLGRGLAGALIVEEPEPIHVDRDVTWLISDWRLNSDAEIVGSFANPMEATMGGHVGNTVTVNGQIPGPFAVRAGERIRLRLINAAPARIIALRFEGHRPLVIALNGQPCEPHEPEGDRVVLGPAMRADVVIDMSGSGGQSYAIVDDFYDGLSYTLRRFVYANGAPLRTTLLETSVRLPTNPIADPNLPAAVRYELVLQGGMMDRSGLMPSGTSSVWSINGVSGMADVIAPAFSLARGRTCHMTIRNMTGWWHPMHLHGFAFRILARNGVPPKVSELGDTMLMTPLETVEVAFVADNPGDWMLHCHVMDHQEAGLMTIIRVA